MEEPPEGADPMTLWFGPWEKITGIDESEDRPAYGRAPQQTNHTIGSFITIDEAKTIARRMLGIGRNGDFRRSVYSPPSVWRVLEIGEVNVSDVPCCSGCGTPFVEIGRYGILVWLGIDCADRHDPAPPPKPPRKELSPEEEGHIRVMDEARKHVWDGLTIDAACEIEKCLEGQLGIPMSTMFWGLRKQVPS